MNVEILYLSWNRLEYTRASMELLRRNTDWRKVDRLVIYDDGSVDGTREFLDEIRVDMPVDYYEIVDTEWRTVSAPMNDYVANTECEAFVKLDNDIAVPPGWLNDLLLVASRNKEYELIGMEAAMTSQRLDRYPEERTVKPTGHIGGVGFMRTRAFTSRKPIRMRAQRTGFTIWQHRNGVPAGWLTPDLPVVQLDRIPEEPWASLAAEYVERDWSRYWAPYESDMGEWWDWIPADLLAREEEIA